MNPNAHPASIPSSVAYKPGLTIQRMTRHCYEYDCPPTYLPRMPRSPICGRPEFQRL